MTDQLTTNTVWVRLCALKELPADKAAGFRVNGQRMVLARCDDVTQVFQGFCSHMLFPLADSKISNCLLTCSLHRSTFNVNDGTVADWVTFPPLIGPALGAIRTQHALKTFNTRVENGDIFLEWPGDDVTAVQIKLDFKLLK